MAYAFSERPIFFCGPSGGRRASKSKAQPKNDRWIDYYTFDRSHKSSSEFNHVHVPRRTTAETVWALDRARGGVIKLFASIGKLAGFKKRCLPSPPPPNFSKILMLPGLILVPSCRDFLQPLPTPKLVAPQFLYVKKCYVSSIISRQVLNLALSSTTMDSIMLEIVPGFLVGHNKVTIVGAGQVGLACAYSILQQVRDASDFAKNISEYRERNLSRRCRCREIERRDDRLTTRHGVYKALRRESRHGYVLLAPALLVLDFALSEGSKVCVITAGVRQREGESRLSLVERNTDIFRGIVSKLVEYSPNTILLVVSNPGSFSLDFWFSFSI